MGLDLCKTLVENGPGLAYVWDEIVDDKEWPAELQWKVGRVRFLENMRKVTCCRILGEKDSSKKWSPKNAIPEQNNAVKTHPPTTHTQR